MKFVACPVAAAFLAISFLIVVADAQGPSEPDHRHELRITASRMTDPPAIFATLHREPANPEATRLYREAMKDTWGALVKRNDDPAYDRMLSRQPSPLEAEAFLAWVDWMLEHFEVPIAKALRAHDLGAYASVPPEVDADGDLSVIPVNGLILLSKYLLYRVLYEMEIEGPDSVTQTLPKVCSMIDDWCHGCDPPLFISNDFEETLESIVCRGDSPNLAVALARLESPLRSMGQYYEMHPEMWQSEFRVTSDGARQVLMPSIEDDAVLPVCKTLLSRVYTRMVEYGDASVARFENIGDWEQELERLSAVNRAYLNEHGYAFAETTAAERLAVAAGIARFNDFALRYRQLYELPIPDAIKRYPAESESQSPFARAQNGMCVVSKAFVYWQPRPEQYWYTEQAIDAMAFVSYLRQYAAVHRELPGSVRDSEARGVTNDPITNREWSYARLSAEEAELELASWDGKVRKVYRILLSSDSNGHNATAK